MKLIYTGEGRYTIGVPARDLSESEIQTIADNRGVSVETIAQELVNNGLYAHPAPPKKKRTTKTDEDTQEDSD